MRSFIINSVFLFALLPAAASAEVVEYSLTISRNDIAPAGETVEAMTVNGGIPGPTLEFTLGDTAVMHVTNTMDVATSVHWHGLLLPNRQDGVSYLTTPPIKPGMTYTYEFPITHTGTYWYHSHTGLQEQRGVYGSIVVRPEGGETVAVDHEQVVVLSDWTNEDPDSVMRNLKRGDHWYAIKKGSGQSLWGAFQADSLGAAIAQSWDRMPPMDISDVAYDAFLANGHPQAWIDAQAGDRVRLRFINAAASSYFYLDYAGGDFDIIAADGPRVETLRQQRLLMAIAETYDIVVTVPDEGAYEFRATAQDGSGHASIFIGDRDATPTLAADIPKPDLYNLHAGHDMAGMDHSSMDMDDEESSPGDMSGMDHSSMGHGSMNHDMSGMDHSSMDMAGMDHSAMNRDAGVERPMPPYEKLRSPVSTAIDASAPLREYELELGGDMERYVWTLNGDTLSEADKLLVKKGERVRFIMKNNTMMHHPMHLHGHFFRVLKGQGEFTPLKHTVDVPPMGQVTIEFAANEEKDWFFHCHVLYHMKAGMSRIVSYEDSELDPDIAAMRSNLFHDPYYVFGEISPMSQMASGKLFVQNTRNTFALSWENDYGNRIETTDVIDYEAFLRYEYYIDRYMRVFVGGYNSTEVNDSFGHVHVGLAPVIVRHEIERTNMAVAGVQWLLPFRIESTWWVDENGEFKLMLDKHVQLTERTQLLLDYEIDTLEHETWNANLEYRLDQHWFLRAGYHSVYGSGAGVTLRF